MITGGQMGGISKRIRALDAAVAAKVDDVIKRTAGKGQDALRDAIFTELQPACQEAFELSSQLAQAVYNGWRMIGLGEAAETVSADVFDQEKFDNMAYTAVAKADIGEAADVVKSYSGFNIRDAYSQTLFACAASDNQKPKLARVPQGLETCRFCMMLASRGFVYPSGKSGEKVHNHANCDCIYVASWDADPRADGYDPDYYYDVYKHPERHPEINDAINARRRELYREKMTVAKKQNTGRETTSNLPVYGEYRGLSYIHDGLAQHIGDGSMLDPLKMVMDDTGFDETAARQLLSDMFAWTGEGYSKIRRREGAYSDITDRLEEFLKKSVKYKGETFRGIGVPSDVGESIMQELLSGNPIDQLGISSWATDIEWAQEFASMNEERIENGVKIIFHLEDNKTGVSIKHIASAADNDEVLMSEKTRYILNGDIRKVTDPYDGDFYFVPVKEI